MTYYNISHIAIKYYQLNFLSVNESFSNSYNKNIQDTKKKNCLKIAICNILPLKQQNLFTTNTKHSIYLYAKYLKFKILLYFIKFKDFLTASKFNNYYSHDFHYFLLNHFGYPLKRY